MSIAELGDLGAFNTTNNTNIDCIYENFSSQTKDLNIEKNTILHRVRMGPTRDADRSGLRVQINRILDADPSQVSMFIT